MMALCSERRSTGQELPVQSLLFLDRAFYADLNGGGRTILFETCSGDYVG